MMGKKMVVTDLDGTILTTKNQIIENLIDELIQLDENGHIYSIASGRHIKDIIPVIEILREKIKSVFFIISSDGQYIFDSECKLIRKWPFMESTDIIHIEKKIKPNIIQVVTNDSDYMIISNHYKRFIFNFKNKLNRQNKKACTHKEIKHIKNIEKLICYFPKKPNIIDENYNIIQYDKRIEVYSKYTDKIYAINELSKNMNIEPNDIIFFGDDNNDVKSLSSLKWSYGIKTGSINALNNAKYTIEQTEIPEVISYFLKDEAYEYKKY